MSLDARRGSLPPNRNPTEPALEGLRPDEFTDRLDGPAAGLSSLGSTRFDHREPSTLIGVAPHWSHRVRPGIASKLAIDDAERLYEEDPHTERFLGPFSTALAPDQSRYEVDMNRPPDLALYSEPERAWGARVWAEPLDRYERERSLELWYEFHRFVDAAVAGAIERFGRALVFDLHSYNERPERDLDREREPGPTINLGTAHLRLDGRGEAILDWIRERLAAFSLGGTTCSFGENVVFHGGYLNRRLSRTYGPRCLTVSVEFKKVFMDARTGEPDPDALDELVEQMDALVHDLGDRLDQPVRRPAEVPEVIAAGW